MTLPLLAAIVLSVWLTLAALALYIAAGTALAEHRRTKPPNTTHDQTPHPRPTVPHLSN